MEQGDGKLAYGVYVQVGGLKKGVWRRRGKHRREAGPPQPATRASLCPASPLSPALPCSIPPASLANTAPAAALPPQNGRVKGEAKKALRNVIER